MADVNQNLALWLDVQEAPAGSTKTGDIPGQGKRTTINAQHVIKQATEQFGPVGIGWGWNIPPIS